MSPKDLSRQRVVLTGAAGIVGSALRPALAPKVAELRLSDIVAIDDLNDHESFRRADLEDAQAVESLLVGADAVIHLGGVPDEAAFNDLTGPNLRGAFNVFEGARRQAVGRVVYASSNHVTGFYPTTSVLTGREPVRPDGLYGATKAFGEALGRLYADKFALEVIAVRIGSFEVCPTEPRHLSTWLSHDDAGRLFEACLTAADGLGFHVVYGVSANSRSWWQSSAGDARIGYRPLDDAEAFSAFDDRPDGPGRGRQGGAFTDPSCGGWAI